MTRADFYLLGTDASVPDFTCRLVDKVYNLGQTIAVWLTDTSQAADLDRRLWTFRQESFIPHVVTDDAEDTLPEPVRLCVAHPVAAAVLVNLTNRAVPEPQSFERIAEVVPADEAARAQARERYRVYRDAGCELEVHSLGSEQ